MILRIAEYKQIDTRYKGLTVLVDDYNEQGEVIGQHEETLTHGIPVMGMVYRDETPEEAVERERIEAEMPKPEPAPEPPKDVRITREDFDLLDVQEDNTIYHIYEEDGSITTIKGVN